MKRFISNSIITLMLVLSVGIMAQAQEATYTPLYVVGDCPTQMPVNIDYECGTVIVPEDRSNPDAGDVSLAVAILRHPSGTPAADPIIYLEGGPGGSTFAQLSAAYELLFRDFHEASGRDLIVFDQRGVGFSSPQLTCPEVNRMALDTVDYNYEGEDLDVVGVSDLLVQSVRACGERLQEDVNLAMYTTRENAADVNDLRIVLGYDEVNLWGISYGSKLAVTAMRDYPDGIRSAIIDAILPPQLDFVSALPSNMDRAFNVLFDRCEADSACNEAYPNLEEVFWNLYDRLQADPVRLDVLNPLTAQPVRGAVFDGYSLTGFLFQFLYQTDVIPSLPKLIYDLDAGDYRSAELYIQVGIQQLEIITTGMLVTFQCQDEVRFADFELAESEAEAFSRLGAQYSLTGLMALDYCDVFIQNDVDESANEAVVSDIPTLVLSGEFDPITPPANGDLIAETLSNSFVYEFAGVGHGATFSSDCSVGISVAFLNDPTQEPDASCIDELDGPQFVTPDTPPPTVTMVESQLPGGVNLLLPEGWLEIQPGVFVRQTTPLDQGALLTFSDLPLGQEVFILSFAAGVGAPPPQIESTLTFDSGEWSIYVTELQGYPARIAAIRDDFGLQVFILVGLDEDDIAYLYENLLLESLSSYQR